MSAGERGKSRPEFRFTAKTVSRPEGRNRRIEEAREILVRLMIRWSMSVRTETRARKAA